MSKLDVEIQNKNDAILYIAWINKQDLFLVKDLLTTFSIQRTQPPTSKESFVSRLLVSLRNANYIQCSGKKGTFIQYITVKAIPSDYSDKFKAEKRLSKFDSQKNIKK